MLMLSAQCRNCTDRSRVGVGEPGCRPCGIHTVCSRDLHPSLGPSWVSGCATCQMPSHEGKHHLFKMFIDPCCACNNGFHYKGESPESTSSIPMATGHPLRMCLSMQQIINHWLNQSMPDRRHTRNGLLRYPLEALCQAETTEIDTQQ